MTQKKSIANHAQEGTTMISTHQRQNPSNTRKLQLGLDGTFGFAPPGLAEAVLEPQGAH